MNMVRIVDEKTQIHALDRTESGLPIKRGRCATMTTTLFAALTMLNAKVIGDCMSRHRHQKFIQFLKKIDSEIPTGLDLHLIVDRRYPQTSACGVLATATSAISPALYPDFQFLVEPSRAMVSQDHRQMNPSRHFRERPGSGRSH